MSNRTKNIICGLVLTASAMLPVAASAITFVGQPNFPDNFDLTGETGLLNTILIFVWWIFLTLAVIFFIIIGILFFSAQGRPEKVAQARQAAIWGVVAIAVGLLAFSIVNLISNVLIAPPAV